MTKARDLSQVPNASLGFKNRIINGDMRIDQRNNGASQTINNTTAYTVDRWYVGFVGGSGTSQRVSGTGGFQNAIRMTGGSGITASFVGQKIESFNSADLAGNIVTVSFRASSSTLTSMTWNARFPNAVDNYSGVTSISSGSITLTSTPTNYTFSFTCPSGVTNGLEIFFLTGGFTSGTLDITGVQLEKGSTATSFDYRPYGTELALCQRYCEVNAGFFNAYISYKMGGHVFAVPKRAVPTVTFYSGENLTGTAGSATEQNMTGAAYPITFYVATVSGITGVNITYGTTTNMGFSSISVSEL